MEQWAISLQRALSAELPRGWRESAPWGYPQQSELALIGGVFAAQLPASAVDEVTSAFMMARPGKMLNDLRDLAALDVETMCAALGSTWGESQVLGVSRMRAAVIIEAAERLVDEHIHTAQEYRDAVAERPIDIDRAVRKTRGLGAVTSESISTMMQAVHRPGPDVIAYVYTLLGVESTALRDEQIPELLAMTAKRLTVQPRVLLHALWEHVSAGEDDAPPL